MSSKIKKNFKVLDQLYNQFKKASKEMAGYPDNQIFDYSKLFRFLEFDIINLGDPFRKSWYYRINTDKFEREVVGDLAQLFHAPKDNYWGYVTSGGTEGNYFGLHLAREMYPNGVLFFSEETHYSIHKAAELFRMPYEIIPSLHNGEIDYNILRKRIHATKNTPIIVANIGTTMKGAVDDVAQIKEIFSDLGIKKYYIHCDAAFYGMLLPFIPEYESQGFDFRLGIDSISISGHKMIGTPFPCGVVIAKKDNVTYIGKDIEYTGSRDNTITGSRNGLASLLLWYELKCSRGKEFKSKVKDCLDRAAYAVKKFNDHHIHAWRNKNSIIVVFPRPLDKTIQKWQLAPQGTIAHLITLPQVTYEKIDAIVHQVVLDLKKKKEDHKVPRKISKKRSKTR